MKKLILFLLLLSNTSFAQLPYTWSPGVNPGWTNVGSLTYQAGCSVVTTNCAGNYANNLNTSYTSPTIDASCSTSTTVDITFTASGNTEYGFDFLFIEYSLDNGVTWINPYGPLVGWTGNFGAGSTIPPITVPTSSTFKFRFTFTSDASVRSTGYKISDFDIICTSVLPIELTYFGCQTETKDIKIDWTTATETNNNFFNIMRSSDGVNWFKIGTAYGNGTTISPHNYEFIDNFPLQGDNYYRLIQVDYNGVSTASYITSCHFNSPLPYIIEYQNMLVQDVNIEESASGFYIRKYINGDKIKVEIFYKQ